MNKKELLNELLKKFPEFEKDKKSLEKTLDFLMKENPEVKIDKKFKKKLKNRLNTFADLKMNKKTNKFWFFAVPSFSFLFIIVGVFYIYKDMIFENNSLKNIENTEIINENNDFSYEDFPGNSNDSPILEMAPMGMPTDGIMQKGENKLKNRGIETDERVVDDTEIINSLEDMGEANMLKANSFSIMADELPEMDFQEFCESFSGKIIKKDKENKCELEKEYCLEKTYKNGDCEWKEK